MANVGNIVRVSGVTKNFKLGKVEVQALKGVDLKIPTGYYISIMGPSGSGKSTLMHLLGGLDKPTTGEVLIDGQAFSSMNEKQRGVLRNQMLGFVYQFHHLLAEFTAVENVAMPLLIQGVDPSMAKQQAESMLDKVGLNHRLAHKPGELSGGERQRAAIARALVTNPRCVLADEPTGNLDQQTANKVYQLMLELNQELQTSFLVVTHDMSLAQQMDRILKIENGCLMEA